MTPSTGSTSDGSLTVRLVAELVPAGVLFGLAEATIVSSSYIALEQYARLSPVAFAARLAAISVVAASVFALAVGAVTPMASVLMRRPRPLRPSSEGAAVALSGGLVGGVLVAVLAVVALGIVFPGGVPADRSGTVARIGALAGVMLASLSSAAACRWMASRRPGAARRSITLAVAILSAGWVLVGPWGVGLPEPPPLARWAALQEPPLVDRSLVLVTVDTLRASHMSLYGYGRATTPLIDGWAEEAAVFEAAITPKGYTAPAVASLMTGLYPSAHGVRRHPSVLGAGLSTLPELFRDAGYRTAAFVTNPALTNRAFGFDQGFAEWTTYRAGESLAEVVLQDARAWLDAVDNEPFLLWIHLIDPHTPYRPPAPYDERFVGDPVDGEREGVAIEPVDGRTGDFEFDPRDTLGRDWQELDLPEELLRAPDWIVSQYDGEIAYLDAALGPFLEAVRLEHPAAATVLTADHGESMAEHGYLFAHGMNCYEPVARIPLVISWPGGPAARVVEPVSLTDVLPTLVDLFDLALPTITEGRSLAGHLTVEAPGEARTADAPIPRPSVTEAPGHVVLIEARNTGTYASVAARTADRKLVMTPRRGMAPLDIALQIQLRRVGRADVLPAFLRSYEVRLFALDRDPDELLDISSAEPETVESLAAFVWQSLHRGDLVRRARGPSGDEASELDPETLQDLRDLGYIR